MVKSLVDRRQERAEQMLAKWNRKLRLASTKVRQYRRKVARYEKARAKRAAELAVLAKVRKLVAESPDVGLGKRAFDWLDDLTNAVKEQ